MKVTRSSFETMIGLTDWFAGNVYVDTVAVPGDGGRVSAVPAMRR